MGNIIEFIINGIIWYMNHWGFVAAGALVLVVLGVINHYTGFYKWLQE